MGKAMILKWAMESNPWKWRLDLKVTLEICLGFVMSSCKLEIFMFKKFRDLFFSRFQWRTHQAKVILPHVNALVLFLSCYSNLENWLNLLRSSSPSYSVDWWQMLRVFTYFTLVWKLKVIYIKIFVEGPFGISDKSYHNAAKVPHLTLYTWYALNIIYKSNLINVLGRWYERPL